jgi:hypothetical protein
MGRCRLSCLWSGGTVRWTVRLLGCVWRRSLYWVLNLRISSLTDVIWRSCRRTIFGTYHGWKYFHVLESAYRKVLVSLIEFIVDFDLVLTTFYNSLLFLLESSVTFSPSLLGCDFQHLTFPFLFVPELSSASKPQQLQHNCNKKPKSKS